MEEYAVPDSPVRENFSMMIDGSDHLRTGARRGPSLETPEAAPSCGHGYLLFLLREHLDRTSTTRPHFSHDMWNQHDASLMLIPRSSNIAEGWHHGFNSMLSCSNPTMWRFLDCLKAEQSLTDVRLPKRLMRERPEPRAPKWILYDQRIVESYEGTNI